MRRLLGPALALFVALTPSCLGGQTGQPEVTSSCPPEALPTGEAWRGRTAQAWAEAFAGVHTGALHWIEEEAGAASSTAVDFDDALTLSLSVAGATGTVVDCGAGLEVVAQVEVVTTESGLGDSGIGVLSFTELAPVLAAQLSFDGAKLSIDARLTQTDAAATPQGWLVPHVTGAPGVSAMIR